MGFDLIVIISCVSESKFSLRKKVYNLFIFQSFCYSFFEQLLITF